METTKQPRLGRGLEALLGAGAENGHGQGRPEQGAAHTVPVDRIDNNPFQPRKSFDEDELAQLGESIKAHGILQPLVVRPAGDRYQLIAGERRLRAAQVAGLAEVPVQIVDFNDQQVLEAALVENIQRTDLNPIEKAQGFKDYLDRFGVTQEQLATRLGLDRTTISNLVNLLHLPQEVQDAVRLDQISLGHAKILKGLHEPERQIALCKEVMLKGLSVKALEMLVKQQRNEPPPPKPRPEPVEKTAHVQSMEDEVRQRLAVKVQIRLREKDKGQIVLHFESNDDFERLMEVLRR
ncbi:MAG TPA: ParB/RepB/Spo0J family partition protein [Gemmataceae bacterium]